MTISTKEELQFLLHRALEIEKDFESISVWKGFVSIGSKYRPTVLTLARDSHKHRLELEKLLKSLNLDAPNDEIPEETFDFEGMMDMEILQKIVENDQIVADLYAELAKKTDPKLVAVLLGDENVSVFYDLLNRLVEDENRHVKMVKSVAGDIVRVQ
jgi:rubrerythrin